MGALLRSVPWSRAERLAAGGRRVPPRRLVDVVAAAAVPAPPPPLPGPKGPGTAGAPAPALTAGGGR